MKCYAECFRIFCLHNASFSYSLPLHASRFHSLCMQFTLLCIDCASLLASRSHASHFCGRLLHSYLCLNAWHAYAPCLHVNTHACISREGNKRGINIGLARNASSVHRASVRARWRRSARMVRPPPTRLCSVTLSFMRPCLDFETCSYRSRTYYDDYRRR
jgi:hypothetical protein